MISAFIVVGNYLTEKETIDNAIPYDFYQLPAIGDTVALNSQLEPVIERMRKEWALTARTRLNFVRGIAWVQGLPFVKLGVNPNLVIVDMIYGNRPAIGLALNAIPRVGDMVYVEELGQESLYVTDITHSDSGTFAYLSTKWQAQRVHVSNDCLDVSVTNPRLDVDIIHNYS